MKYKKDVIIELIYKFKIEEGTIDKIRLVALVPNDIKDRQGVKSIQFNINPESLLSY